MSFAQLQAEFQKCEVHVLEPDGALDEIFPAL
jgi:hypothetical protein